VARLDQLRTQCANARGVETVVIREENVERPDAAKAAGDGRRFGRGVGGTDAQDRERRCERREREALQSSISAW
jgi:hypothetical protein